VARATVLVHSGHWQNTAYAITPVHTLQVAAGGPAGRSSELLRAALVAQAVAPRAVLVAQAVVAPATCTLKALITTRRMSSYCIWLRAAVSTVCHTLACKLGLRLRLKLKLKHG
jgi:hypothetical protein